MPQRPPCQICKTVESKYTCSGCRIIYCSVPCYKQHKESSCRPSKDGTNTSVAPLVDETPGESSQIVNADEAELPEKKKLIPLTSLKWPYVPDESAYPDPLKRDDPKMLQLPQYEAIATSSAIRQILTSHPNLPNLLRSLDTHRGPDREAALERALGVSASDINDITSPGEISEEVLALRELAEAVEGAVRGGKESTLGLRWET